MHNQPEQEDEELKSKSQNKREAQALKALGAELVKLTPHQLNKIPLEDNLRAAIKHAQTINSNGAKRRQLQYIGRLMRDIDPGPIQKALAILRNQDIETNAKLHRLEKLRDELISQGDTALPNVLQLFPNADRQLLRQFIRKAEKEQVNNQPPHAARALFRYLRDLQEEQ